MNNPLRILQAMDARLEQRVEFYLFGRAALVLGFTDPPPAAAATQDVDGIIPRDLLAEWQANDVWWTALQGANDELAPQLSFPIVIQLPVRKATGCPAFSTSRF